MWGAPACLIGALGLRSQVRTFEREALVAVINFATLSVPSSPRATASFSRISDVSRVPHLERAGVTSMPVDRVEEGDDMTEGDSKKVRGCRRVAGWDLGDMGTRGWNTA